MRSFKNASVSANDAGGSRGISCTVGVGGSANCGALLWRCTFTLGLGPSNADRAAEADSGVDGDASVGVWTEPLLPEVEGPDALTTPRLAFVGRLLPGLRFGASKRLIFGSRSHVGLRMALA
jgi:hypothetical protein